MRARSALLAVSVALAVVACAGGEAEELAALRSELDERRDGQLALEERLDALDAELTATRAELDHVASADQVGEVADDVRALDGTLDDVADRLTGALTALEDLEGALRDEATARSELQERVEVVADELGSAIAGVRGTVVTLEGETTQLADQLDALRERVDVIQRQAQQAGAR